MYFIFGAIGLLLIVTLMIFVINPKKSNKSAGTSMFNAENTNSGKEAGERYKILQEAKIEGQYLSKKEGYNSNEQSGKRL